MKSKIQSLALIAVAGAFVAPAYAAVTCSSGTTVACTDGISYTLSAGTPMLGADSNFPSDYVDSFTLNITNINDPSYSYGGKSGMQSFAFGDLGSPTYFLDATPPSGFSLVQGGLNSSGCNGKGAFFCFQANTTPPTSPALPAKSSLSYSFSLTGKSVADFANWNPGFKINWIGTQNNYSLVSYDLKPTPAAAPEIDPGTAAAALTFLAGGLAMLRGRRRRA